MNEPGRFVRMHKVGDSSKIKKKSKNKQKLNKKQLNKIKARVSSKQQQQQNQQNFSKSKTKPSILKERRPHPVEKKKVSAKLKTSEQKKEFHEDLVDRLKGSRFRFINELLYTHKGADAIEIFNQDSTAFSTYHDGYRNQVEQWPINPLDRIIKSIKTLPRYYIVADFGCGEGRLAKSIPHKCYSLDLVAANSSVVACDMAHTPLESNSINVAVYCLSLMGTNLKDFILEANRVLKIGGHLKIAEIESRFDDVNRFISNLKNCGFHLTSKDVSTKVFYFLYFKKVHDVTDAKQLKDFSLKPCIYKKR